MYSINKDHQKPLSNTGVMKHLERLRKLINLAVKMKWMAKSPFEKYQQKFTRVDKGYLTAEELVRIENKEFKIGRLTWVRDLFIFSCYTGMAYIDVMNLTSKKTGIGIDGERWLSTYRQKTMQSVRVPLLSQAFEILNKYSEHPISIANGTLFPKISTQELNSYLKEIAYLCDVGQNLNFHIARHTFATTIPCLMGTYRKGQ